VQPVVGFLASGKTATPNLFIIKAFTAPVNPRRLTDARKKPNCSHFNTGQPILLNPRLGSSAPGTISGVFRYPSILVYQEFHIADLKSILRAYNALHASLASLHHVQFALSYWSFCSIPHGLASQLPWP
jgi:hypothetical protein